MIEDSTLARPGRPKDAAKRDEIVIAATELFMDNGYELTSMEAVAKRAGVSKLTIYSHFADKAELFRGIIARRCDRMAMPETLLAMASLPAAEALTRIARDVAEMIFSDDSLRLMRVIQAEAVRHPEVVQTFYETGPRRVRAAFGDLLAEFDRRGKLRIADPRLATEQFFSLLKGEKLQRVMLFMGPPPTEAERAAHAENVVAMFLAAYRPD